MPQAKTPANDRQPPVIVWLRDNLRLADNRALSAAAETGQPVLVIYVYDDASPGLRPLGGASRWWLHHSLAALGRDLAEAGATLGILRGAAGTIVPELAQTMGATAVFWSRRYGGAERAVDTQIKTSLGELGIGAHSFNDFLLVEPWEITTRSGDAFQGLHAVLARAARARRSGAAAAQTTQADGVLAVAVCFARGGGARRSRATADATRLGGRAARDVDAGRSRVRALA